MTQFAILAVGLTGMVPPDRVGGIVPHVCVGGMVPHDCAGGFVPGVAHICPFHAEPVAQLAVTVALRTETPHSISTKSFTPFVA
jgi:hypothetical protein